MMTDKFEIDVMRIVEAARKKESRDERLQYISMITEQLKQDQEEGGYINKIIEFL